MNGESGNAERKPTPRKKAPKADADLCTLIRRFGEALTFVEVGIAAMRDDADSSTGAALYVVEHGAKQLLAIYKALDTVSLKT